MPQPNRLADAWTDTIAAKQADLMAEMRNSDMFKKYGEAAAKSARAHGGTLEEVFEDHARNISGMRTALSAKYGRALFGPRTGAAGDEQFRAAPYHGSPI